MKEMLCFAKHIKFSLFKYYNFSIKVIYSNESAICI